MDHRGRPTDDRTIARLVRLRDDAGLSIRAAARECGIDPKTALKHLRQNSAKNALDNSNARDE